ncbi:MAG TPA: acyloxyacyl hydrolase [Acidobacteriaceae bacterium]
MKFRRIVSAFALLVAAASMPVVAQTDSASRPSPVTTADPRMTDAGNPARAELATRPWEYGPFFQGGKGVGYLISDYKLYSAGMRLGKVLTDPLLGGFFRGQFEYAGEIMPYWQAFTPPPHRQLLTYHDPSTGLLYSYYAPYGGGTYTGFSLTPIILRWDFLPHHKVAPWFQGAGGLIYTTHKFPPEVLVPHGTPGGTSVWNFSPQGGLGLQYFISPQRSVMFSANAVHISNASLGDRNPGVNASVQFQIGYTWWSRKP